MAILSSVPLTQTQNNISIIEIVIFAILLLVKLVGDRNTSRTGKKGLLSKLHGDKQTSGGKKGSLSKLRADVVLMFCLGE